MGKTYRNSPMRPPKKRHGHFQRLKAKIRGASEAAFRHLLGKDTDEKKYVEK